MKDLLVINSSARSSRSITRQLTHYTGEQWSSADPKRTLHHLDVGLQPPSPINESWIAAAYTPLPQRTQAMQDALRESDLYVDQLIAADAIVIGAPLYNFGPPAQLKAFFEQSVRIGRTFDFGSDPEIPYVGLLPDTPVLVITSSGATVASSGDALHQRTYLEPEVRSVLSLMGLNRVTFACVDGQQADPDYLSAAIARARQTIEGWLERTISETPSVARQPVVG